LAIFEPLGPNRWQPMPHAAGPFAGLQGGAVASLLTAEIEALADQRKWGAAISSSAWFLRPTPMAVLRTGLSVVTEGGRVSVIDNTLWPDGEDQPCATVRVTLSRERAVEVPGFIDPESDAADPTRFPVRTRQAAHGRPWFMDAMEAREGDGVAWFRMNQAIIGGAGSLSKLPLSSVLGPADWTHGIARPLGMWWRIRTPTSRFSCSASRTANGSACARKPDGGRRAGWGPEAASCSISTARSAGSQCR
jgi:hypothetical protein